ncbi:MAG: putative toxin-antitoxin system toxin component, PIN family [Saprospiraceae bacterium]|nr:putative toxin-antitoxin system toxin component, PIN family [Saprospiraceae bacterium]
MGTEQMRIVLDTNIILSVVSRNSPYHEVWQELLAGTFDLYLTTEILLEYEEKLTTNFNPIVAEINLQILSVLPNVFSQTVYFNFPIIEKDPDDNKFIDCAFACNAHFLVSNDRHYHVLKQLGFPKINLVKLEEFIEILRMIKAGTTPGIA